MIDYLEIAISLDGDKWCALIGENLQEGVAGFADTPVNAIRALCDEFALNPWNLQSITLGKGGLKMDKKTMGGLGYRKLPKGKPPLLSDEEINLIEGGWFHTPRRKRVRLETLAAEAQRELDIKHCEEVSNNIS